MKQKVSHKKVEIEGEVQETLVLFIKEPRYENSLTTVEITFKDASELRDLLIEKLDSIVM